MAQAATLVQASPRPADDAPHLLLVDDDRRIRDLLSRFLAGEIDRDAAMQAIESGWNDLNDQIGKDDQLKIYKATIGAK